MGDNALQRLWTSLKPEGLYDTVDLPLLSDPDENGEAFLWNELLEQARGDGQVLSFFIGNETVNRRSESWFVSLDCPSAEAFAKSRMAAA